MILKQVDPLDQIVDSSFNLRSQLLYNQGNQARRVEGRRLDWNSLESVETLPGILSGKSASVELLIAALDAVEAVKAVEAVAVAVATSKG